MKALTAAEMREVDRLSTERCGIPSLQLMEAAGASVAAEVHERILHRKNDAPCKIAVLCGKGNNGGDGFVVARHLQQESTHTTVYLFGAAEELRGDAAANFQRWRDGGGEVVFIRDEKSWEAAWPQVASAEILVDGLLGTGLRGAATGVLARALADINRFSQNATRAVPGCIVAIDTPSGLPSDGEAAAGPVLRAHLTVTFTAPKIGQLVSRDAAACGQLVVCDIGSPQGLVEEVATGILRASGPDEFRSLPLIRAADSHKGTFGHVLLVAGSLGKSGAAILAGQAALFGGAGLVTIATPETVQPLVAAGQPEYMTEAIGATLAGTMALANYASGRFTALLEGKSVVAIGPGLGTHPETQKLICKAVREISLPMVLDADGLNAFAGAAESLADRKAEHLAVTPHPGEMARLLGVSSADVQQDRVKVALHAARLWNAVVILKGYHTVLASPDGKVFVNTSGNAGLAKGGTGDVLTGVLAAMTSQFGTKDWLRILALGVYLHGSAAGNAGWVADPSGMLASDVALCVRNARGRLLQELRQRG
jgi:ADP-dependent NAD(P)H-hydrate dehydratase / NAD(P)H-hydrate epimerase